MLFFLLKWQPSLIYNQNKVQTTIQGILLPILPLTSCVVLGMFLETFSDGDGYRVLYTDPLRTSYVRSV